MSITTLDINELTRISVNLATTTTTNISSIYSPYYLYVEEKNSQDVPQEYIHNLYSLYKSGIDNLIEDAWTITIGENVSSHTQMLCIENYSKIMETQFSATDDVIEYDKINEFVQELDPNDDFEVITGKIYNWFADMVGLNFDVNENPENADDSNLILPQRILDDIKEITESILSKLFRNLMQLIRVQHEYRLYGKNATILGGCSSKFENATAIGNWSALPPSCWTQYTGNYMIGKSAYGEDVGNIGTGFIKNSNYHIGPYNSFGISPHTHEVSINKGSIASSFGIERKIWKSFDSRPVRVSRVDDPSERRPWKELAEAAVQGHKVAGFGDKGEDNGSVKAKNSWSYAWNTNSYCKLMSPSNTRENIFQYSNTTLPTYETYVWKWTGVDNTDIKNPTKYIVD